MQHVGEEKDVTKDDEKKQVNTAIGTLPFHKLLSYADALDWILMALGTLGSVVHGMALPLGYLLLGKALNAYGDNIKQPDVMVHALYKVLYIFPEIIFFYHLLGRYHPCGDWKKFVRFLSNLRNFAFYFPGCSICMVHGLCYISSWDSW